MNSIHCIDLGPLRAGGPLARDMGQTLRRGLEEHGFVRVVDHGVDAALIRRAYALYEQLFSLDADALAACGDVEGGQRGYTPFGVEHARDHAVADLKEFFHVGQELPHGHPLSGCYPPNVWPAALPELRDTTLALYRALEGVARALLVALAEAFGLASRTFAGMIEGGNSILRVAHYPPVAPTADPRAFRAAPHEDINLITLLCEASDSGLEILTREGDWMPVAAGPCEIVADAGDMLARITNGVVPATTHRVVAGGDAASRHRYSMPFFAHPRPECDLSVEPHFVEPGCEPRFASITADAFLRERLREIGLTR